MITSAVCGRPTNAAVFARHQSEPSLSVKSKCIDALNQPEQVPSFSSPVPAKHSEQPPKVFSASSFVRLWEKKPPSSKPDDWFCRIHLLISSAAARLDVTSCVSSSPGSLRTSFFTHLRPLSQGRLANNNQQTRNRCGPDIWCRMWSEDCQWMLVE